MSRDEVRLRKGKAIQFTKRNPWTGRRSSVKPLLSWRTLSVATYREDGNGEGAHFPGGHSQD